MAKNKVEDHDWFDIQNKICRAMKIKRYQFRDLLDSSEHFYKWCDMKGYGEKDSDGKGRGSSNIWFNEYNLDPLGEASRPEYIDYWHLALKSVIPDNMRNDTIVTMSILRDYEDNKEHYTEGKQWKENFFNAYQKVMKKLDPKDEGIEVRFSW